MTRTNAENARAADQLSEEAKTAAESGTGIVSALNESMHAINESSHQISKIIKVIEEIAFQTNLLSAQRSRRSRPRR
jgi:methyl-accepting chemotaxis protein